MVNVCVSDHLFLALDRITEQLDKLYNTKVYIHSLTAVYQPTMHPIGVSAIQLYVDYLLYTMNTMCARLFENKLK